MLRFCKMAFKGLKVWGKRFITLRNREEGWELREKWIPPNTEKSLKKTFSRVHETWDWCSMTMTWSIQPQHNTWIASWLQDKTLTVLECPSPDLNPTEHLWRDMKTDTTHPVSLFAILNFCLLCVSLRCVCQCDLWAPLYFINSINTAKYSP